MQQDQSQSYEEIEKINFSKSKSFSLIQYYYPDSKFVNLYFKTTDQVKEYLAKQNENYFKNMLLRLYQNSIYAYIKCKYCKIIISMTFIDGLWTVKKFSNKHIHKINEDKHLQEKQISNYMKINNLEYNNQSKIVLQKTFNLTQRRYYYLKGKLQNYSESLLQLLKKRKQLYWHKISQQQYIPQSIVIISPAMLELYYRFGDYFMFEICDHNLKERSIKGKKWYTGLFIGVNNNSQNILFAVAYFLDVSQQTLTQIIDEFINIVKKSPQTIFTSENKVVREALKQTQCIKSGQTSQMINAYSVFKEIKRKIGPNNTFLKLLKDIMNCKTQVLWNSIEIKIVQSIQFFNQEKKQILKNFISNLKYYSFLKSRKSFIGLTIWKSKAQQYLGQKYQNLSMLKLFDALSQINDKAKLKKQKLQKSELMNCFGDNYLLEVKKLLSHTTFRYFLVNFLQSQKLIIEILNEGVWRISTQDNTENHTIVEQNINCDCGEIQKTGIPCAHLIKILKQLKVNYVNYIKDRWIYTNNRVKKLGRPKFSRRNKAF